MHTLARLYIKTAIVFLGVGLAIGGWMIARRELTDAAPNPYLGSAHTHALFVGFVMMTIMGVGLWLFPRPQRDDDQYDPRLAALAYWLLTIATTARVVGELLRSERPYVWLRLGIVGAGFLEIIAIGVFFYTMWSRIRPAGSQGREAKGERF